MLLGKTVAPRSKPASATMRCARTRGLSKVPFCCYRVFASEIFDGKKGNRGKSVIMSEMGLVSSFIRLVCRLNTTGILVDRNR